MRSVWKFPIPVGSLSTVEMPRGAKILHVACQYGKDLTLWAEVDTEAEEEVRHIAVFGTGHQMTDEWTHHFIGTVLLNGGALVLHVYEIK